MSPINAACSRVIRGGERAMLIAVVFLAIMVLALGGALALLWRRMRYIEDDLTAYERGMGEFEDRVLEQLDTLDAEVNAATDAERIIERAQRRRGGKVYEVPVSRWSRRGQGKKMTGVLILLALAGSAGIASQIDDPEDGQSPPRSQTTTSATPAAALPTTEAPMSPAPGEPPATAPPITTPITESTTTSPPTTPPLADGSLVELIVALQLGDELSSGVLGERTVPDLADIITAQIRNDPASVEDALDVIESCLHGDNPGTAEDCPGMEPADPLDGP